MIVSDIELDGFSPAIRRGDFCVSPSENQHTHLRLLSTPGDWRGEPTTGIALARYLKARMSPDRLQALAQEIELHHEADGVRLLLNEVRSALDIRVIPERFRNQNP